MNTDKDSLFKSSLKKSNKWLNSNIDDVSKSEIIELQKINNKNNLIESFYKNLEFGTGGMRGLIGIGSNKINKFTLGLATQGLSNYLKKKFNSNIKVAIAYDSRKYSKEFALITADILSANNISVLIFKELRPTPLLSYAVRKLKCNSGIVITASHNPKEYNGYKVYWNDGGQIVKPHDELIIKEINKLNGIDEINFKTNNSKIQIINKEIDELYFKDLKSLSLNDNSESNLEIVFSPIHGTGITMVPKALKSFGFKNIIITKSQKEPDENFSTVSSPNPEEYEALKEGIKDLKKNNFDILVATDPDGDRVGVAIRNKKNIILINGNQLASLIIYYTLKKNKEKNNLHKNNFVVKTIVTTNLIDKICEDFKIKCYSTLTGFKHIANLIKNRKNEKFIAGGEESYGYLVGDFVRDKDAIISTSIICEIASWAKKQSKNLMDILDDIYDKYGIFKNKLYTIKLEGIDGRKNINKIMKDFRTDPPNLIFNMKTKEIIDYSKKNNNKIINEKANVIQFITKNNSSITVRPSGTEPKIKFYFSLNSKILSHKKIEELINKEIEIIKKKYAK
jgi:phosphoglucomutase|tara:strand:+ start:922 stop:2619 length:1698 start_codon:yes stop_codon:yes gene_type:complete